MINTVKTAESARWDRNTELIISVTELVFSIAFLALFFGTVKPTDANVGIQLTGIALLIFPVICAARLAYVYYAVPHPIFGWASALLDIAFLTTVIHCFTGQYGLDAATLKAPSFIHYFMLIALHAMRFDARLVVASGGAAALCWGGLLINALMNGAPITHSYLEYVSGGSLMVGTEVEKIFGLLFFTAALALGVHRAKAALTDAVAKQFAEAEMYRAVEASRAKSEFLANMSHEIRTPMNGLLGIGDLLERTSLDTQQKEYVRILRNSGDALLGVINDILDISKIEAGKLELSSQPFTLRELIENVSEAHAPAAVKKGLELVVSVTPPNEPSHVLGDEPRLRQVLSNLIGNAIKFTDDGHVHVELQLSEFKEGEDRSAIIHVKDTGVGIKEDHLARVFDKFEQADNSVTRKYGGTGLGLAISKNLVTSMNGDITVTSEYGKGTCFTIDLSLPAPSRQDDLERLPKSAIEIGGKKVLIIDDLAVNLRILKDMLNAWDIEAISTITPEQGIKLATEGEHQFDAILMDYHMPNIDGVSASKQIADILGENCPPILLLTSMDEYANVDKLKGSSINSALIKPIRAKRLHELLSTEIKATKPVAPTQTVTTQSADGSEEATSDLVTPQALRVLLAEDNEVNRMVISHMLKQFDTDLTMAEDGQYAVEFFNENQDYDVILMDISMPRLDGLSAVRIIRQVELEKGLPHTPIIGITAHATEEGRLAALGAGMDECLTKPVKVEKLTQAITHFTQGEKEAQRKRA